MEVVQEGTNRTVLIVQAAAFTKLVTRSPLSPRHFSSLLSVLCPQVFGKLDGVVRRGRRGGRLGRKSDSPRQIDRARYEELPPSSLNISNIFI